LHVRTPVDSSNNPDVNLGDSCEPYNPYEEILGDHLENLQ